jgi:signal transduction histidine kinase
MGIARTESDDRFTFEDLALLDSIASHVSSAFLSARLAEELAESREMQLMSQWSSMILHDLKNYLAPLRLVAQNLVKYQDRKEVVVAGAADLNRVADRMQSFIGTLSELRDNPQIARDLLDVNALIEKTLTEMKVEQQSSLQVKLDLQAMIPVMGDEGLLRRVLENLVRNAIEAMTGSGTLAIRTAQVENGDGEPPRVQVSITDTGLGIPKEFLTTRLCRPFATTKRGGMGLGLYQCRTIVRAHGGQLRFESKTNVGTTVRMILRASPPEPPDSLQTVSETRNGALL